MKKRYTITEYMRQFFEAESKPTRATIIRRLNNGQLSGVKEGGTWYVTPEKNTENQELNTLFAEFDKKAAQYGNGKA